MQKKSFSWLIISIFLFLFFPVAIWMIVKKVTTEKWNMIENGKGVKRVGLFVWALGLFYVIMAAAGQVTVEEGENLVSGCIMVVLVFGFLGLLCMRKGAKYQAMGNKYNRYLSLVDSGCYSLSNIAAAYPTDYETAAADIQLMINDGMFPKAHIDYERGELVLPGVERPQEAPETSFQRVSQQAKEIQCPYCGGRNKVVPGSVAECEYCGSQLTVSEK